MVRKIFLRSMVVLAGFVLIAFAAGCGLTPQFSYQGRLTDASGKPLNGTFSMTFKLFDASEGGTEIYSETESVSVTDGLFDAIIGPADAIGAGVNSEDLAQPLWLEVTINDGTYTETLTPRQRLYGAPYAFTLMAGSVISGELDTTLAGPTVDSIVTIQNVYDGDVSNPALPALIVRGETAVELSDPNTATSGIGRIISNPDDALSDIGIYSQDDIYLQMDTDDSGTGVVNFVDGTGSIVCTINEAGGLSCIGSKSAVVDINGEPRLLYAVESPEVWFEDFGSAALVNGQAQVTIEALYAETVNLEDYYVYLTPLGDCNGLYIAEKTATSFTVMELGGGTGSVGFDYRIIAHRLGYEDERLEIDPARSNKIKEE